MHVVIIPYWIHCTCVISLIQGCLSSSFCLEKMHIYQNWEKIVFFFLKKFHWGSSCASQCCEFFFFFLNLIYSTDTLLRLLFAHDNRAEVNSATLFCQHVERDCTVSQGFHTFLLSFHSCVPRSAFIYLQLICSTHTYWVLHNTA